MKPVCVAVVVGFIGLCEGDVSAAEPETFTFARADDQLVRHSEGTAVELKDGRLLLVWQEFRQGKRGGSDFFPARLVSKVSADGGRTWGNYRVRVKIAAGDLNVFSPSLLRLQDGSILLAFLRKHDFEKPTDQYTPTSAFVQVSRDEGKTFEPQATVWSRRRMHLCNNTLKQLSTGRIVLPSDRDNSAPDRPDNWACGCACSATTAARPGRSATTSSRFPKGAAWSRTSRN